MVRNGMILVLSFLIGLSCILLPGCAKPPTQEIENAEKTLLQAKTKEADLYVQEYYAKAEDALRKAKELVLQKKYKEAKEAAEETVALALQAISQVELNKKHMGEEVDQMILEGQKFMEEIKTLAASAIRKKALADRAEIEGAVGKYEIEMVGIKEQRQAMKIRNAYDRLASLHTEMRTLKERVLAAVEEKDRVKKQ